MAANHNSKLPHKNAWLQQIADGLQQRELIRAGVGSIQVTLTDLTNEIDYEFTLPIFLDYMANETHWDERGDWSQISELSLRVI